jgi:hypothetical protein
MDDPFQISRCYLDLLGVATLTSPPLGGKPFSKLQKISANASPRILTETFVVSSDESFGFIALLLFFFFSLSLFLDINVGLAKR